MRILKTLALVLFAASLLNGCGSLAPARKEFFQDKVERLPEASSAERETEKQTVDLLRRRTQQTVVAAVLDKASPSVALGQATAPPWQWPPGITIK